jgi:hypothetical protein
MSPHPAFPPTKSKAAASHPSALLLYLYLSLSLNHSRTTQLAEFIALQKSGDTPSWREFLFFSLFRVQKFVATS